MDLRSSAVRDAAVALLVVVVVLGGLYVFAGTWPPMVVVESRSMMHPDNDPGYGNLGTADPGDIILVKSVGGRDDVAMAVERSEERYGGFGDVIVFYPDGNRNATPVIHRAISFVEIRGEGDDVQYRVYRGGNDWSVFGSDGIYLPEMGIGQDAGYTRSSGWTPENEGFLTQGDNPETNAHPDQVASPPISSPVKAEWIKGETRGELPWLGLIKLAFGTDLNENPPPEGWVRFGNAYAPADLWIMLFASGLTLVVIPLGYDVYREWRRTDRLRFPPYLERLRDRYGRGSSADRNPEPVAELQPDDPVDREAGSGGTTTFEVLSDDEPDDG